MRKRKRFGFGFDFTLREPMAATLPAFDFTENCPSINSQQDIQQLSPAVIQVLAYEFRLGESASRLCPVLLADQTVAIFAVAEQVAGDAIQALITRIQQQGYRLATPARYVLSVALLLELIRDPELQPDSASTLALNHAAPWSQADLFNAFLDIVRWGVQHQASDIHINIFTAHDFSEVRFSIAGRYICPAKYQGISTRFLHDVLSVAWMNIRGGNGAVFDPHKEQQGSLECDIDGQAIMLRWGALAAEKGPSVCLRILRRDSQQHFPTLAQLGYLPKQQMWLEQALASDGGAIVFSGAVGSGKSTTLASMVASLPEWRKVISIEDPLEYLIPNAVQVSLSRDLHEESHGAFATKLRALKRSAMSDVLLGEIRDVETGRAFTDLSSSGVRLYTTVHASSAALVPARLHSDFIGVSLDLLASPGVLRLIVYQCLLPRLCAHCAVPVASLSDYPAHVMPHFYKHTPFTQWLQRFEQLMHPLGIEGVRVRNSEGCSYCARTELRELHGWSGRVVCAEVLEPSRLPRYLKHLAHPAQLPPLLQEAHWPDRRSSALVQCSLGVLDPFDVEAHFALFESPHWQHCHLEALYA